MNFILSLFIKKNKPQKPVPKYTGPHAAIWEALDYNLHAGQLVKAI